VHALITPSWYPQDASDPRGTFFREQAEILVAAGHRVTVLAAEITAPDPRRPASVRPALSRALRLDESEERGVRVLRLRLPVPVPGVPGLAARALAALAVRIARPRLEGVEVIHAHSVHPGGFVARALAHELEVPWVLTEHRPSSVTAARTARFEAQVRSVVEDADVVSAVSEGLSRALEQRFRLPFGEVRSLANPISADLVDATAGAPTRPADGITRFVHLSHLAPIKRVEDLLAAFTSLSEERCELVIAGGSPERVRDLAERTGAVLSQDVPVRGDVRRDTGADAVLVGHLPRDEVPALVSSADRFVLASAQESFGIVLAESLAAGVPVIATDTWGARDVIGNDPRRGTIVPVGDVEALAVAMRAAARSPGVSIPVPGLREDTLARYGPASYAARTEQLWRTAHADPAPSGPERTDA
jgi:glycosyltransferase involved in cell wall biosynthesis